MSSYGTDQRGSSSGLTMASHIGIKQRRKGKHVLTSSWLQKSSNLSAFWNPIRSGQMRTRNPIKGVDDSSIPTSRTFLSSDRLSAFWNLIRSGQMRTRNPISGIDDGSIPTRQTFLSSDRRSKKVKLEAPIIMERTKITNYSRLVWATDDKRLKYSIERCFESPPPVETPGNTKHTR